MRYGKRKGDIKRIVHALLIGVVVWATATTFSRVPIWGQWLDDIVAGIVAATIAFARSYSRGVFDRKRAHIHHHCRNALQAIMLLSSGSANENRIAEQVQRMDHELRQSLPPLQEDPEQFSASLYR
jgi:hypothetical protein